MDAGAASLAALALAVSTALYAGFQWTVRLVVYPQFALVGPAEFARHEAGHQRRVTWAVGPLFVAVGGSCLAAFATAPGWLTGLAGALFAGVLAVTAFGAVPEHRVLTAGWDAAAHRRLLRADSARLVLALLDAAVAVTVLVRAG